MIEKLGSSYVKRLFLEEKALSPLLLNLDLGIFKSSWFEDNKGFASVSSETISKIIIGPFYDK